MTNILRAVVIGSWAIGLIWLENHRALRTPHKSKLRRDVRNLAIALPAGVVMQTMEVPMAFYLAQFAKRTHWGILQYVPLSGMGAGIFAVLLMDYTLYWWHYLTHRVPFLWRFHQVHHLDQEMDATTALRFHFGEIMISLAFRAAQICAIAPDIAAIAAWQLFLFLCIMFHHSNVRLPLRVERRLAWFVMTPRLHGIHHSIEPNEVNSNWSSGLTIWDWLHGTLRTTVPQKSLTLGIRGYVNGFEDTIPKSLLFPFTVPGRPPEYDHRTVRDRLKKML